MNYDRIREIQKQTAYPNSRSVQQALLQMWNECEQEKLSEQKNPWRPIIKGEWPECKPDTQIVCSDEDGRTWENLAGNQGWNNPLAVKWKYAEDE